jgi:protein prenyltransferase alpha subunit repeat containing protein 1
MIPEPNELPLESQVYYPLIVVESKLGISKSDLAVLLKEAHEKFITLSKDCYKDLEQVTRIMILLKPDNYTAMNRR